MIAHLRIAVLVCAAGWIAAAVASAQDAPDPGADARVHLGPVGLTPRVSLTNLGLDSNIFSTATNPQQDVTATLVPSVDSFVRLGTAQVSGTTSLEYLFFEHTTDQRSLGFGQTGRVDLPLARFTPFVAAGDVTSFQPPNQEIDVRVRHTTDSRSAGVDVRIGYRTRLDLSGSTARLQYADGVFDGVDLADALNHSSVSYRADVNIALTALTTFVLSSSVAHDRFDVSADRDADSAALLGGFTWQPDGVLSGKALVGFRRFQPIAADVPAFRGFVSAVDVAYTLFDRMRLAAIVHRDVDYSFEVTEPYFVTTTIGGTVTHELVGPWDAQVGASRAWLHYEDLTDLGPASLTDRIDHERITTAGVGYRLNGGARLGLNVEYDRRQSPIADREFHGFRLGGSFTYGQ